MPSIQSRRRKGCFPRAEPEQTIKDRRAHVEEWKRAILSATLSKELRAAFGRADAE